LRGESELKEQTIADNAFGLWAGFSSVLAFVLYFRSNVAYGRWWEGGTLLQQTRGEWFNAYSSLIAFTSPDPAKELEVEAYLHMLARLMSLLFCSALQQVSPDRDRAFPILDSNGLDSKSMKFLHESSDRVEVILQWIQRSTILNMASGVLPIPPPVMSRAFQEISRGIVNLQNARKIADFPFPWPYAQASMVMLMIHWALCPLLASILLNRLWAPITCFSVIFFLWSINFIALDLESPFGAEDNDLPMLQMQVDWNKSVATLLAKRANQPPTFEFDPDLHRSLELSMSDGSRPKKKENCKRMTVQKFLRGSILEKRLGERLSRNIQIPGYLSGPGKFTSGDSTDDFAEGLNGDSAEAGPFSNGRVSLRSVITGFDSEEENTVCSHISSNDSEPPGDAPCDDGLGDHGASGDSPEKKGGKASHSIRSETPGTGGIIIRPLQRRQASGMSRRTSSPPVPSTDCQEQAGGSSPSRKQEDLARPDTSGVRGHDSADTMDPPHPSSAASRAPAPAKISPSGSASGNSFRQLPGTSLAL
jgi:predicted membrane chloride channel (bestrophin family)